MVYLTEHSVVFLDPAYPRKTTWSVQRWYLSVNVEPSINIYMSVLLLRVTLQLIIGSM